MSFHSPQAISVIFGKESEKKVLRKFLLTAYTFMARQCPHQYLVLVEEPNQRKRGADFYAREWKASLVVRGEKTKKVRGLLVKRLSQHLFKPAQRLFDCFVCYLCFYAVLHGIVICPCSGHSYLLGNAIGKDVSFACEYFVVS